MYDIPSNKDIDKVIISKQGYYWIGTYGETKEFLQRCMNDLLPRWQRYWAICRKIKYNGQVDEITPARVSDEITRQVQQTTEKIYRILNAKGIIRVDYIIDAENNINLLEVNTTPGMTATSFIPQQVRAAGLDIADVMTEIIENEFLR